MRICSNWSESTNRLTRSWLKDSDELSAFYKGGQKSSSGSKHVWETKDKKKPFSDAHLDNMVNRINVIFKLRSQHDELLRLLSAEEQDRFKVASTFDSFRKINPFYTNEYYQSEWHRALKDYERQIEPMEKEICGKLRKEIFGEGKTPPAQLLRDF